MSPSFFDIPLDHPLYCPRGYNKISDLLYPLGLKIGFKGFIVVLSHIFNVDIALVGAELEVWNRSNLVKSELKFMPQWIEREDFGKVSTITVKETELEIGSKANL